MTSPSMLKPAAANSWARTTARSPLASVKARACSSPKEKPSPRRFLTHPVSRASQRHTQAEGPTESRFLLAERIPREHAAVTWRGRGDSGA